MVRYIIRRLLSSLPVLLGILFVTFALARLLPGDPCRAQLGEHATDEICDAFARRYGLDKPIPTQFWIYLKDIAKGDLGTSFRYQHPVTQLLIERLPVTIELSVSALTIAVVVGIPLGLISAIRQNSAVDVGTMLAANVGVSMPVFWLGLMLAYLFGVLLKGTPVWLPPGGRLSSDVSVVPLAQMWNIQAGGMWPKVLEFISNLYILSSLITFQWRALGDAVKHLILPAAALGTIPLSIIARMTRSSLLDVLRLDYIRAARAKGVRRGTVIMKHAFRNALLPIVTIIGLSLGTLLGGAVLTETIFGLSGVGRILYDAITARDYSIVQGFTLVIAFIFVTLNLVVDVSYAYLDPRIRLD
jgi:peptide/nickel transport system permease protein